MLTPALILGALLGLVALIVLDVLSKIAVSLARGRYQWGELLTFLRTNVGPYLICYGGLVGLTYLAQIAALPNEVVLPFQGLAAAVYLVIVGRLVASIYGNFRELGISTPSLQ